MPPVTRRSAASEALRMPGAGLAPSEVTSPVCHLRPVGDSSLGFTLLPNETKVLGRRDMESMISRMTRRAAHKAKHLSRKQLQVSFNAQAGSCTVKWIGHSHESLLQRASSGAPVLIRRETLELEAGDILWLHAYYSPFNTLWKPGGCAPGFVVDLPPVVERQRAQMQKLAREALLRVAASRVATVDEVRDAIERAQALHIPEQPTAGAIAGDYGPARARLATLLRAQRKRRRSLGLEDLSPPADYLCPVTREVMKNPVVASDGHSYEREVLEQVLRSDSRSPLTREVLHPFFFANLNLKKRILDFEDEAEQFARCGQKALRLTRANGADQRVPR
ncbi:hypothetical protein AB1Y20_006897 [Prymnesium parvum]|uniref:U-box domain-containing protein n=1 Tax=Prymnesium parvum TaxID=97485 RepID=A0AB34J101_PRYPA